MTTSNAKRLSIVATSIALPLLLYTLLSFLIIGSIHAEIPLENIKYWSNGALIYSFFHVDGVAKVKCTNHSNGTVVALTIVTRDKIYNTTIGCDERLEFHATPGLIIVYVQVVNTSIGGTGSWLIVETVPTLSK